MVSAKILWYYYLHSDLCISHSYTLILLTTRTKGQFCCEFRYLHCNLLGIFPLDLTPPMDKLFKARNSFT